jgi:hypothetical protein
MWLNGWLLAASITRTASTPTRSACRASSFAKAMLRSRYVVSASFASSAPSAEPIGHTSAAGSMKERYSSTARASPAFEQPPTSFG